MAALCATKFSKPTAVCVCYRHEAQVKCRRCGNRKKVVCGCIQVCSRFDVMVIVQICFLHLIEGANGMWIIGGRDAKEKNFKCSHGLIFCRTPSAGV